MAPWRRVVSVLAAAAVSGAAIAVPLTIATSAPAQAWKPPTHLFGTEAALSDAGDGDGLIRVGPPGQTGISVAGNATILQALRAFPKAYRAGTIGPDAFPDLAFGQTVVHPGDDSSSSRKATTDAWVTHLWEQAWKPRPDGTHDLEAIAFATGYMGGHAAGDVWAHSFVNHFAKGVFPELKKHPEHAEFAARHIVVEGYVDKHRPGFEAKQAYEIDAPTDFIADALILHPFVKANGEYPLFDYFLDKKAGLIRARDAYHADNTTQDLICAGKVCIPNPLDSPVNLIELGIDSIAEAYTDAWIKDIDRGLRAWPVVWEQIAQELFTGKKPEMDPIKGALKTWFLGHFLSMMGVPDFVGEGFLLADTVLTEITTFVKNEILRPVLTAAEALPAPVGPFVLQMHGLASKTRDDINSSLTDLLDDVFGVFVTAALGVSGTDAGVRAALDRNEDGRINPSEVLDLFREPEEFIADKDLFPTSEYGDRNIRAELDAAMGVLTSDLPDVDGDDPRTSQVETERFRDYRIESFNALRDTAVMAQLALLDQDGLNQYLSRKIGPDQAGASVPVSVYADHSGPAPGNVMLGWMRSIDGDHQWRRDSAYDGGSYGTGTMVMWQDCVLRDYVFRSIFAEPVPGRGSLDDQPPGLPYDAPSTEVDVTPPSISLAVVGGKSVPKDGVTYLTPDTDLRYLAQDGLWPQEKVQVDQALWRDGQAEPPLTRRGTAADGAFRLTGEDGKQHVRYRAVDGYGRCVASSPATASFSLDTTPPTITISSPQAVDYASDRILSLDFTAEDPGGSGVDPDTRSHEVDGAPVTTVPTEIDLFDYPAGSHTYRARQADLLGNVGEATVTFRTVVTHDSLMNNLNKALARGCVAPTSYTPLRQKLDNAAAAAARGDRRASRNQLESFKNELAAQRGKAVSVYCADVLARNATALQAA